MQAKPQIKLEKVSSREGKTESEKEHRAHRRKKEGVLLFEGEERRGESAVLQS